MIPKNVTCYLKYQNYKTVNPILILVIYEIKFYQEVSKYNAVE